MIFIPPMNISYRNFNKPSVFLAGSIEMGAAIDWQSDIGSYLDAVGWEVFNPHRTDWDSSRIQSYNNPQFFQQVRWEMDALKLADKVIMYFDPNSKSPISLLELGLLASSGRLRVICPEGFYRKGNVDIVCQVYDVPQFNSFEELKENL